MDKTGFEKISQTLSEAGIGGVRIAPVPSDGENVRFVTIEPLEMDAPCDVLNALQAGGLMAYEGTRNAVISNRPELSPIGVQKGSLTFEDTNYQV